MSDDTGEIESILGQFRPACPDDAVRGRVVQQTRRQSQWAFAEAMAALFLIGTNLALIGASVTSVSAGPRPDEGHTQRLASAIRQLDLPMSREETYAMAQELSAGEHLITLPLIHGDSTTSISNGAIP